MLPLSRLLRLFLNNARPKAKAYQIIVEELECRLSPSVSPAIHYQLHGDYVAEGVGMQGRSSVTLSLSGVPSNATVEHAFLLWSGSPTFTFGGQQVTGTNGPGYQYELPVGVVTADGSFNITGFSGDGLSLVVIYDFADPRYPLKDIFINKGFQNFATGDYTQYTTSFSFSNSAPTKVNATTTFIGGQGDDNKYDYESFASSPSGDNANWTNLFAHTDGLKWDTVTQPVSAYISPGDTSATVSVQRQNSGDDLFYWVAQVLSVGAPAVIVTQSGGSTDVSEAGSTDTYTVALANQPEINSTVYVSLQADAQLNVSSSLLTFNTLNWWMPQTVTVSAKDDFFAQGNRTVQITHTASSLDPGYNALAVDSVAVNITDNDVSGIKLTPTNGSIDVAESGTTDTFTAVLTSQPTGNVSITFTPGSYLGVSPQTIVFTSSNWSSSRTITVSAIDDQVQEGSPLYTDSIGVSTASTDPNYNSLAGSLTANITDNDVASVAISPTSLNVAEGGAAASYTALLTSKPLGDVTVTVHLGTQLTSQPSTLVFTTANWSTPQLVTVTAVDDKVIEGTQVATIVHSISSSDTIYANLTVPTVGVTIADNDFPGLVVTPLALSILEGKSDSYTVALDTAPLSDVTVSLTYDTSQMTLSTATLVFTQDNWNKPQTITVTALDNTVLDGNRAIQVSNAFSSTDTRFVGVPPILTTVNILDDEDSLIVKGTANSDKNNVLFSFVPGQVQVILNGRATFYPETAAQILMIPGSGTNTVHLVNPTMPVTILGGKGSDTVTIDGSSTSNTFSVDGPVVMVNGVPVYIYDVEHVVLAGKKGNDILNVQSMPLFGLAFQGGGGSDTIVGPDQANTWKITGPNAGTLNSTVSFTSVVNLTGGSGNDTFIFGAGKMLGGKVDGAGGSDTLDFSASRTPITADLGKGTVTNTKGFLNIEQIIGGSGSDKLIAAEAANTWNITSPNAGDVNGLTFQSFENLTGGGLDDHFVFAAGATVKGKIDGGGGNNSLDFSNVATNITVNLQTRTATNTGGWLNIESFAGGAGTNTLIGANKVNSWALTATNAGMVGGIAFQGFANLTGGTLVDTFDLGGGGDWSGVLDGGPGLDSILLGSGDVYVPGAKNAGMVNGHSFKNVEKIT